MVRASSATSFVLAALLVTLATSCDTVQRMRVRLLPQQQNRVVIVAVGADGSSSVPRMEHATLAAKVVDPDECPGIDRPRDASVYRQALSACLQKYPPEPHTFEALEEMTSADGAFAFSVGIPGHWPYLVLLQVTTERGDRHYAHAHTRGDSELVLVIPQNASAVEPSWGSVLTQEDERL